MTLATFARANLLCLLLCCSVSADPINWNWSRVRYDYAGVFLGGGGWPAGDEVQSSAGPLFSIWHINGHGYQWQQTQIDAGLPLERGIVMSRYDQAIVGRPELSAADTAVLEQFSGHDVVLRMHNITGETDVTIPRPVVTEETIDQSYVCVTRRSDGTFNTVSTPYILADHTATWAEAGRLWATTPWMVRLQEIIQSPTGVILRENNEGSRMKFTSLYVRQGVRYLDRKGRLVWATPDTPPEQYADPNPATPGIQYRIESGQVIAYYWKSDAGLDLIDVRLKTWVAPRRDMFPPDSLNDFTAAENSHYAALYAAFDANLSPEWRGKLRTCGYGHWSENRQNDAASTTLYLGYGGVSADLTSPDYTLKKFVPAAEEHAAISHPQWPEWSIAIYPKAIYTGLKNGTHAAVDPESFAGFMSHVAWRMQSPGREVRLTYWDGHTTPPTKVLLAGSDADAVTALGRTDLLSLTINDYEVAVLRSLARIHDHPTINRYWREGTTTVLESPLNTASSVKVYATETSIPGERATLLCVYTPCDLSGEIQVGEWTVPAKRFAYYLTGSVQEIE